MVASSPDHFDDDASSAHRCPRSSSLCLLDSDARSFVPANGSFGGRDRSTSSKAAPRNPRETLAAELKALIGSPGDAAAGALIARFGTVGRVMSASREALEATLGCGHPAVEALVAASSLVRLGFEEQLVGTPIDLTDPVLHKHLRAELLGSQVERLYAVFLNRNGIYLGGEMTAVGSRRGLQVSIRTLVHRALDTNAAAILLAHNHPSGDCRPSLQDIEETRRLVFILEAIELSLVDHLIISSHGIYSLQKGTQL